jgi:hypothetical protein
MEMEVELDVPLPRSDTGETGDSQNDIPPLPEIRSEQIRQRVFTLSSSLVKSHTHGFKALEGDLPVDNEERASCYSIWITS